jgi:hypothetical protein
MLTNSLRRATSIADYTASANEMGEPVVVWPPVN